MRAISGTVLVGATVLGATAHAGAARPASVVGWPMALHDARHSATASMIGPQTGHIAWQRQLGANITPGPIVSPDGTVYVATNGGVLFALSAASGSTEWSLDGGAPLNGQPDLSVSPLLLPNGDVLWSAPNSALDLVSPSGQVLWTRQFNGALTSPVLTGSTVYVNTQSGDLVSLDIGGTTPTVRWILPIGHASFASPVVAPSGQIVTTADNRLVVVDDHGSRASVAWSHPFNGQIETSASVGPDGTIVVGTNDPFEYAFTAQGRVKWTARRNTQSYSAPSVSSNGRSYFGGNSGHLQIVATASGHPWATDTGSQGLWGAQAVDGRGDVYFGTIGSHLYGYTKDGRLLFDLTTSGPVDSYPALAPNGFLVVGDESGDLYAIGS